MKFIGFRTLKTGIGAALAIIIAKELGLEYAASAGIITILSIQKTRKKSFKIALRRIGICILALTIAIILFGIFSYNEIIFGAFLLIFIPLAVKFNGEDSIVVSSVLVSHLLVEKSIELPLIWNELALMFVGVSVALILNFYMPNLEERIKEEQVFIENAIKEILLRMAEVMRGENICEEGDVVFTSLEDRLRAARKLSYINLNNNFIADESYYVKYMEMRMRQLAVLKDMREHFRDDFANYEQAIIMGNFTDKVASSIYEENSAEGLLSDLYKLRETYRNMELPKSREEFESRASLFQFLNDIEQFLKIKNEFIREIR
ncbi:aromatic acid exporter family protein [Clostridium malenominatum]|uniref:Aromatic acid exporter family protein n=1 Tax=Clostridium malenominatum TaxID=1539 RepID=A0ABP3TZ19_9CLOT